MVDPNRQRRRFALRRLGPVRQREPSPPDVPDPLVIGPASAVAGLGGGPLPAVRST